MLLHRRPQGTPWLAIFGQRRQESRAVPALLGLAAGVPHPQAIGHAVLVHPHEKGRLAIAIVSLIVPLAGDMYLWLAGDKPKAISLPCPLAHPLG